MKNPLHYQISEYDCGPTSLLNGMSYLFQREEIPPEVVRNITLYCLDCFGADGGSGKSGTSCTAMTFLSNWLNGVGQAGHLSVSSRHLSGKSVHLGQDSLLRDALRRGGAAVVLVDLEGWHYVLLTDIQGDAVYLFDPYYRDTPLDQPDIQVVLDHPAAYNRIVPAHYLEQEGQTLYAMGPLDHREAVLLFNTQTELTQDETVEFII
jgi:hypothetical protein